MPSWLLTVEMLLGDNLNSQLLVDNHQPASEEGNHPLRGDE